MKMEPTPSHPYRMHGASSATGSIPSPTGIYVKPADAWIDPSVPQPARAGDARPCRPCARRAWRGVGDARDAGDHGCALRPAGRARRSPMARRSAWARSRSSFVPAGHVLGSAQIVLEHRGERDRRVGRLQAPPRPDLRAVRAGASATSSSPRRPSACRCSAIPTPATRSTSCSPRCTPIRSAACWSAPMRWARRSA